MFTVYVYLPATYHERYCQLSFQCRYQIYTVVVTLSNYSSHCPVTTPKLNEKFRHANNFIWSIKYSRLRYLAMPSTLSLSLSFSRTRIHRNDRNAKFKPLLGNMSFQEVVSTSWLLCSKCGEVMTKCEKAQRAAIIRTWSLSSIW